MRKAWTLTNDLEWSIRNEGSLQDRYDNYVDCVDDGQGRDITTGGKTYVKTFDQWLDNQEGYPVEQDKHYAKQ